MNKHPESGIRKLKRYYRQLCSDNLAPAVPDSSSMQHANSGSPVRSFWHVYRSKGTSSRYVNHSIFMSKRHWQGFVLRDTCLLALEIPPIPMVLIYVPHSKASVCQP